MLGREFAHSLQLDDDPPEANEVRPVGLIERLAFVGESQHRGGLEGNALSRELDRQALLINGLEEAGPHLPAHLEHGSSDQKRLVGEEQLSVISVFSVVHSDNVAAAAAGALAVKVSAARSSAPLRWSTGRAGRGLWAPASGRDAGRRSTGATMAGGGAAS